MEVLTNKNEKLVINRLDTIRQICKINLDMYEKEGLFLSSFERNLDYIGVLLTDINNLWDYKQRIDK